MPLSRSENFAWPELPLADWRETRDTLHMLTQIVGKVRGALSPLVNHWWNVALYVAPRGFTTSAIPFSGGLFEVRFDFFDHRLVIETSHGASKSLPLGPRAVADFYADFMAALASFEIQPKFHARPDEVPDPVPFAEDRVHHSYDPEQVQRFWRVMIAIEPVFQEFRSRFIGKCSPVHFFWGAFDLAVTRFCGRIAPERPGADPIQREGYSHEVSSAGFWTGGASGVDEPVFYSYMAPEPNGFRQASISPSAAFYHEGFGEFFLPYDFVRCSDSPAETLLAFFQSCYEAGAQLAHWDRAALERQPQKP